ncbi:MAG: LptA/OstA family protein [Myxococcota bacterium]
MIAWVWVSLFALAAEGSDDRTPVEISAKGGMSVDLEKGLGRAEGDVVIRRRDLVVCCDRAEAVYAKGQIRAVACRGNVVIRRTDGTRIVAEQVNFQPGRKRLALSGRVKVWRSDGQLTGDRMTYALDTGRLEVRGARSTLKLTPDGDPPPAAPKCPRPQGMP